MESTGIPIAWPVSRSGSRGSAPAALERRAAFSRDPEPHRHCRLHATQEFRLFDTSLDLARDVPSRFSRSAR